MNNIAFVGPMHSGKTTAANYLVERYGYERIGLADQVKYRAASLLNALVFDVDPERWFDGPALNVHEINTHKAVFRPFLQWLGTDFVREYLGKPDFWINEFLEDVECAELPVVCDDVRFPNEAEALRDAGFEIIRLERDEYQRQASIIASGGSIDTLHHPSETQIRDIRVDRYWWAKDVHQLQHLIDRYIINA